MGESVQLSLFPSEAEQIEQIDLAESAAFAPFASLISQEVIDEFLRVGGNEDNPRLAIGTAFMKQLSVDSIADHMRRIFQGGNGLIVDGRQYSGWYDEDGIHLSPGKSARYVNMAQTISWGDAARRVGELMESGQYMSMMELAAAPTHERAALAQSLWYMCGDIASEAQGFFPSMKAIRGGGFPDETSRLADRLADPQFLAALTAEAERFAGAYEDNHNLMRFHYHRPAQVLQALQELTLPRREYDSLLTEVAQPDGFITEDELDAFLSSGSSMAGGKDRIYRYFTDVPAHTTKEKADFLKHEYGIGGRSHALSGSDGSSEGHDSKGIKLTKKGCPEVNLSWIEAAKRIDKLISLHRYLTPEEQRQVEMRSVEEQEPALEESGDEIHPDYIRERLAESGIEGGEMVDPEKLAQDPFIQQVEATVAAIESENQEQPDHPPEQDARFPYQVGDTVFLEDGKPFIIERISPLGIELRDPSLVYPILRAESQESFARLMERYPQEQKQPEVTSETVAVYPAEQNGLPYDIVIERMHTAPQKERIEQPTAQNFRITDNHLGEGGAKTKFGYNIAAIRTLKQIEAEGRMATPDEQVVLSRYVGWGGLADAFDANKPAWADEYRQLAAILTPKECKRQYHPS